MQTVRLPLEERRVELAAQLQKDHPEMSREEALSRAKTAVELDGGSRRGSLIRQPAPTKANTAGPRREPATDDPTQSGIVKRAERMAADDAAKKAAEAARYSENLARAQLLRQAS
jgi:hypothetical protein